MHAGRPPLSLGAHGKISTRTLANERTRAAARVRLWDGNVRLVTAVGATASDARALLERRLTARLRLSELDAWRDLTAGDPFGELTYCWLDYLWSFTSTGEAACARYERVVHEQLLPVFANLAIGEITAERVDWYLAMQRAESEASAKVAREVLGLLMAFAVREGVIASNPAATE